MQMMEIHLGGLRSLLSLQLLLLLICGCCFDLSFSHSEEGPEDADYGFRESSAADKPMIAGRPTIVRDLHGYIGVGSTNDQITTSANNYWRIICPDSKYEIFIVLMGMHLAQDSYLHVKTTKFEGCTDKFHASHFHKKSVLAGFFSNSSILSAFRMAYVCVSTDKESLAVSNLQNRDVLDHFASNEDDLELFLQFLNNPEMIFTHSQRLQKILELSEGEEPTNSDQVASGEVNMSAENLTKQDLE